MTDLKKDLDEIEVLIETLDDLISEHHVELIRMYDAMTNLLQALEDDRKTIECYR